MLFILRLVLFPLLRLGYSQIYLFMRTSVYFWYAVTFWQANRRPGVSACHFIGVCITSPVSRLRDRVSWFLPPVIFRYSPDLDLSSKPECDRSCKMSWSISLRKTRLSCCRRSDILILLTFTRFADLNCRRHARLLSDFSYSRSRKLKLTDRFTFLWFYYSTPLRLITHLCKYNEVLVI